MSEEKGLLVTCDRENCGESIFLKLIGTKELDGGYTHCNQFEEKPEGWEYISSFGLLCPHCNKDAKELINKFMKG